MQQETPHIDVATLVTGHFHCGPGYASWRPNGTRDWLLIYTVAGQGRFGTREGGEMPAPPGAITLLKPGTRHDYGIAAGAAQWELLWAHFQPRPHWHEWLHWPEPDPGMLSLQLEEPIVRQKICARLRETHRLATGALRLREMFALNALEEALLWCSTQNPQMGQIGIDPRVQKAMDYLCRHLAEKVQADVLADECRLSPSRMSHLFREQAGTTPQRFQESQRLLRAQQLLDLTPLTVGMIASEVGFENPFYFSLRFKRLTGYSPREWRRRSAPVEHLEIE